MIHAAIHAHSHVQNHAVLSHAHSHATILATSHALHNAHQLHLITATHAADNLVS